MNEQLHISKAYVREANILIETSNYLRRVLVSPSGDSELEPESYLSRGPRKGPRHPPSTNAPANMMTDY